MTKAVFRSWREGVGHPACGVVDQDVHWPERGLSSLEQAPRRGCITEISLDGHDPAAEFFDRSRYFFPVHRAVTAIEFGPSFLACIGNTHIGHDYCGATRREHFGRCRSDAVVRASDKGNMTLQARIHHLPKYSRTGMWQRSQSRRTRNQ